MSRGVFVWGSFAILVGLYITGPIIDPDLWWHIVVGRWILANGTVPTQDYWNMFSVGQPWRAYSWSNEVVLAAVEGRWGIHGLLTLKFMLAVLFSLSLFYTLGRIARDWFLGAFLAAAVACACFSHFTLRPQSLVWVLFIWLMYVTYQIKQSGFTTVRGAQIFLLMLVWANSHLTTPLGIVVIVLGLWGNRSAVLKACAVAVAGMLVTPYFGGELLTFASKASHPFKYSSIAEFQPANVMQYPTAFVLLLGLVLALFVHYQPRTLNAAKVVLCTGFLVAALAVIKFIPFAMMVMGFAVAEVWAQHPDKLKALGNIGAAFERLGRLVNRLPAEGLAFLFICLAIVSAYGTWQHPFAVSRFPVAAVDYIQKNNLPGPILNTFGDGGYLMYRYSDANGKPALLVPIDGRTNVSAPEILKQHSAALRGQATWRDYIESVKPNTILWRNESPLTAILLQSQDWRRAYNDGNDKDGYSVFVRSLGVHTVK